MLEAIKAWFERVPKAERDMPIIIFKGKVYTPRQILQMAERGVLPKELQEKIEKGEFTKIEDIYKIAIERLRTWLPKLPPDFVFIIHGNTYTGKELLEEVEKGSDVGRMLIENEINKWRQVKEKLWGRGY